MLFEEQRRIARFGGGGAGGPPVFACRQARPVGAFRQPRAADPKGVERGGAAPAPSGKHGKPGAGPHPRPDRTLGGRFRFGGRRGPWGGGGGGVRGIPTGRREGQKWVRTC